MTIFATYQCTVCRRSKDYSRDDIRVIPNQCTITKGCVGRLFKMGESLVQRTTVPLAGAEDWYPRGKLRTRNDSGLVSQPDVNLASSVNGALVLAVAFTNSPPTQINLTFSQRRTSDISFQLYQFKLGSPTTAVSGRDNAGKNLRFDQEAIDDGRVTVKINGVISEDVILAPNTVQMLSPTAEDAVVQVIVYLEKMLLTRTVAFTRNTASSPALSLSAWANIGAITMHGSTSKWWLYTAEIPSGLTTGSAELSNADFTESAVLLTASPPFDAVDRYYNFAVDTSGLLNNFPLTVSTITGSTQISVAPDLLEELYPPFTIAADGGYIEPDKFAIAGGSILSDTAESRLPGQKILGPI